MIAEAKAFWDAISGKVKSLIHKETENALRLQRYDVTTAPNGSVMGVKQPYGSNEIFLPYSKEVASAAVGNTVLVAWWGSMSNAKVYYFAKGYEGADILNLVYPVGSIYMSVNSTSPATLFGGTWSRIQDTFLLAAGSTYAAGATGGEASHTLTEAELPNVTGSFDLRRYGTSSSSGATAYGAAGVFRSAQTSTTAVGLSGGGSNIGANTMTMSFGSGNSHNNMPPYLAVYVWRRTA